MRYEVMVTEADHLDNVAAGLGILPLRSSSCRRNRRDDVVFRPFDGPAAEVYDYLVWRIDNPDPLLLAFLNAARAELPLDAAD